MKSRTRRAAGLPQNGKDYAIRHLTEMVVHGSQFRHPIEAKKVLVVADLQVPFQDDAALRLVYRFVERWQPDTLIVNGDLADCYSFSQFDKDPDKVLRMDLETEGVDKFFLCLSDIRHRVWLGGNHEDRWRKTIWRAASMGYNGQNAMLTALANRAAGSMKPDDVFKYIFNTDDHGVEYWPYGHYVSLAQDNLVVTHGFRLSQHSAYTAKLIFERLGRSAVVGHSHRQGEFRVTNLRGTHGVWETGCLCRLDPDYVQFPNWQQGFVAVTIEGEQFYVEQIPILPGPSIQWRGERIRGEA